MKKFLSVLTTIIFILISFSSFSFADDGYVIDDKGNYFGYNIVDDGAEIVKINTGSSFHNQLVIPDKLNGLAVLGIKSASLPGENITKLIVADSVRYIGAGAFFDNKKIKCIVLGKNTTIIGKDAFDPENFETLVVKAKGDLLFDRKAFFDKTPKKLYAPLKHGNYLKNICHTDAIDISQYTGSIISNGSVWIIIVVVAVAVVACLLLVIKKRKIQRG